MTGTAPTHWQKRVRVDARRTMRRLNDVYLLTSLSTQGLLLVRDALSETKRRAMDVVVLDHAGAEKATTRRKKHIRTLLSAAIERTQVEYALQSVVAETEAFVGSVLRHILTAYPAKLSSGEKKIDLGIVLESTSRDEIISRLVETRIASTLYGSPGDYLGIVGEVVSVPMPSSLAGQFSEVKATRDLIVHAQGIANSVYIRKSGEYARVESGLLASVDQPYLRHAVAVARQLTSFLAKAVQDKFGETRDAES
ncbi:MAG: hypothetical protein WBG81_16975 [Rhodanobacter sp.]